jgi:hypothetical protein
MGLMGKVLLVAAFIVVLTVVGGGVFLAYWDIPAPTAKVEKVLPDARFPK